MIETVVAGGVLLTLVLLIAVLISLRMPDRRQADQLASISARLEGISADLARTDGSLKMMSGAQEGRIQGLEQAITKALEGVRAAVDDKLAQTLAEARSGRAELAQSFATFEQNIRETLEGLKKDINGQLTAMAAGLREQLDSNGGNIKTQLSILQESVAQKMTAIVQSTQQNAEQLRTVLNDRLQAIQSDNSAKLEEMRKTVDEKLHATLEQRLGQSFQLVSDRLEQVHRGLGEMQTLATGVGDLKRVLTNVKARGTWGEFQLQAMIDQILTPDQYAKNVATRPGAAERVEIAIKLPGKEPGHPVWLPIDAKFPVEDYQRLIDAHDRADVEQVETAARALEARIRSEAKSIREKYLAPPDTTDFAIMYLPTEGLYAEVLRRPGLAESMQREQRVMISGPTNLAAMLNSLQMGFRTLAIEKRASDVWQLLSQVKTEFAKFGEVIASTQKKLEAASTQFGEVGVRTRAIERKLREVEALPVEPTVAIVPLAAPEEEEG
jgi:DNA recombination protein RmuC